MKFPFLACKDIGGCEMTSTLSVHYLQARQYGSASDKPRMKVDKCFSLPRYTEYRQNDAGFKKPGARSHLSYDEVILRYCQP